MSSKALELDDSLASAHVALALIHSEYEWDLPAAETEYRRAIVLNPSDSTAHQFYAEDVLEAEGRTDEANRELALAQQLDPSMVMTRAAAGFALFLARDYDRAIAQEQKTLDLDPVRQNSPDSCSRLRRQRNVPGVHRGVQSCQFP